MAVSRLTDWDNKQVIGLLMVDHGRSRSASNRTAGTFVGQAFWLPETTSIQKFYNAFGSVTSQTLDPHLFSWDGISLSTSNEITLDVASSVTDTSWSGNHLAITTLNTPAVLPAGHYLFGYIAGATISQITASPFTSIDSICGQADRLNYSLAITSASISGGVLSGTTIVNSNSQNTQFAFVDSSGNQHGLLTSVSTSFGANSYGGFLFKCKSNVKLRRASFEIHNTSYSNTTDSQLTIIRQSDNTTIATSNVLPPSGSFSGTSLTIVSNALFDFGAGVDLVAGENYGFVASSVSKAYYVFKTDEQAPMLYDNSNFFRCFNNWNDGNPVWTDASQVYSILSCAKLFVENAAVAPPSPSAWIKINGAKKAINVAFMKKE